MDAAILATMSIGLEGEQGPFTNVSPIANPKGSSEYNSATMVWYLLFEIANGIFICIGEKVEDAVFDVVLLQVIHKVSPIALQGSEEEKGKMVRTKSGNDPLSIMEFIFYLSF